MSLSNFESRFMKKVLFQLVLHLFSVIGFAQVLLPVTNLETVVYENDTVLLAWDMPDNHGGSPMTLSWLKNDSVNSLLQYGHDSYVGNRYDTLDLRPFVGWNIESIAFYKVSNWTHAVYIWEQKRGEDMHVLYSQEVPEEAPIGLNTIILEENLQIEPSTQYWFAIRVIHQGQQGYQYPIGVVQNEQGVEGKSNLYMDPYVNAWETIPYGFQVWMRVCSVDSSNGMKMHKNSHENQPLTGYRVYRNGESINDIPYSFVTYFEDTEFAKGIDVEYCVKAVYGDEESEPVCASATISDIEEDREEDGITISPNPTNGLVSIEGATVAEVRIFNTLGQLVKTVRNTNKIDMDNLPEGFYLLRIKATDDCMHVGRVMLCK